MLKFWISVGQSRLDKSWKNLELTWPALVERFKKPIRSKETHAEYCKLPKDQQVAIKDVGGFVGGVINGGRRLKNSVTARYLITLDIDGAPQGFMDDVMMSYPLISWAIYSTHKHSPDNPHFRLIIPLAEEVLPDEYEAIARRVAGNIGINFFDPTTFQPERLMYWPSASVDGEYVFREQEGVLLNGKEVLAEYADWKDISQWPVSDKHERLMRRTMDKQEDPREKGGIIGVWCRQYGVREAIETYLTDVYEETEYDDRWSYRLGSGHAGMVVYDDLFSFSHHSTDPTQNRLCNSFDLVRIHLFGDTDEGVAEGTATGKLPSYIRMSELMTKDPKVKVSILQERQDKVKERDGEVELLEGAESEMASWMKKLDMDRKGNVLNSINNMVIVLMHDKALKEVICWNELSKAVEVRGDLPWRRFNKLYIGWTDADDSQLRNYLEVMYGLTNRLMLEDALKIITTENKFHPVKEYLESLEWDRHERIEGLLVRYLGADDSLYVKEVTRKTLVAAVARIYEPGCKFDTVLTLVGRQGLGKSRWIKALGREWYSDTFGNLQNKDGMENLHGVWIMEIGEMAGLKKHEIDAVKLFITKQVDRFRVAFGRRVESYPRQCIFIASTNNVTALQDVTGNRRWWPIDCGLRDFVDVSYMDSKEVDQIWAEACYLYTMGEDLFLTREVEDMAEKVQAEHTEFDERRGAILPYLETLVPENWKDMNVYERVEYLGDEQVQKEQGIVQRDFISIPEIWTELFRGKIGDMTNYNSKFIRDYMNGLPGWKPKQVNRKPWGTQRGWIRNKVNG